MVMSFCYRLKERGGFYYVIPLAASYCPICQSLLVMRATRQRVIWVNEEVKKILVIRRLHCENCNRIHHELPDCLVPYKRYGAKIIESIAANNTKDAPCPIGTVRRLRGWWAAVMPYFLNIIKSLVEKFGVRFGEPPAFRETVRAAVNSNNWVFAHQVCTRSASRPG